MYTAFSPRHPRPTPSPAATGIPMRHVEALGENDRSATGFLPKAEFEATADACFSRPHESVEGWERAETAQARVLAALDEIARTAPGSGAIAVVAHGGVGTLTMCHLKGQPISRAEEQPGTTGGNYFQCRMPEAKLIHGWRPIDPMTST